jgi:hypothetical protein
VASETPNITVNQHLSVQVLTGGHPPDEVLIGEEVGDGGDGGRQQRCRGVVVEPYTEYLQEDLADGEKERRHAGVAELLTCVLRAAIRDKTRI